MFSALALIALMVLIRPFSLQLFAARQQAIYSLDNAEVRHARELRAVDASQRLCGYRWDGMHMLDCPESRRRFAWAALRHPQDLADPSASSSMTPLRTRFRLASARCIARRCWRMLACPMAQSERWSCCWSTFRVPRMARNTHGSTSPTPHAPAWSRSFARPNLASVPALDICGTRKSPAARKEKLSWLGELKDTSQPVR